jgi:glycosyltransferase involved in cell wall biosynthesis
MVSNWSYPKRPIVALEAFKESRLYSDYDLLVGGYGPLWHEMKSWTETNDALNKIKMLGELDSMQIAKYMRDCHALLHPTDYETFSVVCAEAMMVGCLVVTCRVGGIPEVLEDKAIYAESNTKENWITAINLIEDTDPVEPNKKYNKEIIGESYRAILDDVIALHRK